MVTGAIIGGNRNFGASFAGAGRVLQDEFGLVTLYRFELAGNELDVERCRKGIVSWFRSM
jgi:protein involved in ribonucleotide reduction